MSVFITFAAALLIFGAVIAIHEFGHFAVAKLCEIGRASCRERV